MKVKTCLSMAISLALPASALIGCAPSLGGSDYAISGVGEVARTQPGTVLSARAVIITPTKKSGQDDEIGIGTAAGAGVGGALASQIGGGNARYVTGALGALAGGVAGHMAERNLKTQKGMEYQIKLDNGSVVTIAQGLEPQLIRGQKVFVVMSQRDRSRVVPAY